MTQVPTTEQFARAEIDALIAKYVAIDLRLTNQLATAYKNGIDRGIEMSQREFAQRARERAEQILDGSEIDEALPVADHKGPPEKRKLSDLLLPPAPRVQTGPGAARLHVEREAVRIILQALNHQRIEAEAAAALKRAEALEPEYLRIRRDWTLSLARLIEMEDRVHAFREAAGPARAALPPAWSIDYISFGGFTSVQDVLDDAVREGIVSPGDLRKARRVQGDN